MLPWIASLALAMTDTLPFDRRARPNLVRKIEGSELFVNWLVNQGAAQPPRALRLARDAGVS